MSDLTFTALQDANSKRAPYWTKGCAVKPDLSFAVIELGGEVGELQNKIKKLIRFQLGMPGGSDDMIEIADELGDVVICCSLLAIKLGFDLGCITANKFNKTSEKHGFPVVLPAQSPRPGMWHQGNVDPVGHMGRVLVSTPNSNDPSFYEQSSPFALNNQGDYILDGSDKAA